VDEVVAHPATIQPVIIMTLAMEDSNTGKPTRLRGITLSSTRLALLMATIHLTSGCHLIFHLLQFLYNIPLQVMGLGLMRPVVAITICLLYHTRGRAWVRTIPLKFLSIQTSPR
jgi:hypothetical protein